MKTKLSITVDEENVELIEKAVENGTFRNKSHAVEYAIEQILNEILDEKDEKEKGK